MRDCMPREIDPVVRFHAELFAAKARRILTDTDPPDILGPGDPLERELGRLGAAAAEQIEAAMLWELMRPRNGPRFWLLRWRR